MRQQGLCEQLNYDAAHHTREDTQTRPENHEHAADGRGCGAAAPPLEHAARCDHASLQDWRTSGPAAGRPRVAAERAARFHVEAHVVDHGSIFFFPNMTADGIMHDA